MMSPTEKQVKSYGIQQHNCVKMSLRDHKIRDLIAIYLKIIDT